MPRNFIFGCGYVLTGCLEKVRCFFTGDKKAGTEWIGAGKNIIEERRLPVAEPETEIIRGHIQSSFIHAGKGIGTIEAYGAQ